MAAIYGINSVYAGLRELDYGNGQTKERAHDQLGSRLVSLRFFLRCFKLRAPAWPCWRRRHPLCGRVTPADIPMVRGVEDLIVAVLVDINTLSLFFSLSPLLS
jgi:hypothetical protein